MNSSPVLVLDIDGVVAVSPSGPWHANLKADLGLDYAEIQREFFRKNWQEVVRGRLDLFVALQAYFESKGMADRIEAFVAYWLEKDAVIDHEVLAAADAWRTRTGGRVFAALQALARTSTRSSIRRRWASASPNASSTPTRRRGWA
jgi:putative hydrolase of the HAD superfamily